MEFVLECVVYIIKLLYYTLEGIVVAFLPASWCRQKDVRGEKVLITGSGSGLGRLMAVRFAELGSTLILWDINTEGNEATAEMVRENGADVFVYTVDLSNRLAIYEAAQKVKSDVGDVDILINNAGVVTGKKFMDCPDTLIEKTMEVNTNAHFWTVKSFLPSMLGRNHGHIVTIASSAGIFGVTGLGDYCASKFANVGFNEALTHELNVLKKTGVKTTVVCPYYINTGMFSGVKTKFPTLLPIVEPEYAVKKIMEAILTNQAVLIIPKINYLFYGLRGLLPSKCLDITMVFTGVNNCMDDFKGRQKND